MSVKTKVALVTGANSGVGFSLVRRLLLQQFKGLFIDEQGHDIYLPNSKDTRWIIILGCRNLKKASVAKGELLAEFPEADLYVVEVDVSDLKSVKHAAKEIAERFQPITHLFLNAGIMPITTISLRRLFISFLTQPYRLMAYGEGVLDAVVGSKTQDGIGEVFAANVLGHIALDDAMALSLMLDLLFLAYPIHHLTPNFSANETRIVFTSSVTADYKAFDINDLELVKTKEPYHASKYLLDILTLSLNTYFNSKTGENNVHVYTACPGTVQSNIVQTGFPPIFMRMIFTIFRIFISSLTVYPQIGSTALFYLAVLPIEKLNDKKKFFSRANWRGRGFVISEDIVKGEKWDDANCKGNEVLRRVRKYF